MDAQMESLCSAVIRTIETAGTELPTSGDSEPASISHHEGSNSSGSIRWVEYAASFPREFAVVSELRRHIRSLEGKLGPSFDAANETGADGRPLLYSACLGLLKSERRRVNDAKKPIAMSTFSAAITTGTTPLGVFLAILDYLVDELGASPNQVTQKPGACHRPPLHLVARGCFPAAVQAMLDRGACASMMDDEGWTSLMACCMAEDEEGGPPIEDRVETAKILLEHAAEAQNNPEGSDVNDVNFRGYTALHFACEGLIAPLLRLLLDHGADPTVRTLFGESALGIVLWNYAQDPKAAELCRQYLLAAIESNVESKRHQEYAQEEKKMIDIIHLLDDILIPVAEGEGETDTNNDEFMDEGDRRDQLLLLAILKHVGMDPKLFLSRQQTKAPKTTNVNSVESNWYEELHRRVEAIVPQAFVKVYRNTEPTEDEYNLITSHYGNGRDEAEYYLDDESGARRIDVDVLRESSLMQYRQRGQVARVMDNFIKLVLNPITHNIAFAIPSDALLDRIKHHAPKGVCEVGAGTGYWSAMLRQKHVDTIAFDSDPPISDGKANGKGTNAFFTNQTYTSILKGNGAEIFRGEQGARLASERALLLVWPNNPDHIDNAHLLANDEDGDKKLPVWDADCLAAYINGGGTTVIYIGEREERIDATGPDCGFCSSRRFQQMLLDKFDMVEQLDLPKWCFKECDATIWKLQMPHGLR